MSEHEPGIYFGMPEEEYHADTAFSASGAKDMLVSPLTYWMNSALNPDRKETESAAREAGKAFHARILEGQGVFESRYAVQPDKDDYPDAIMDGAGLRAHCESLGLKKSGSNMELCERIMEADPVTELWPVIMAEFEAESEGKIIIKRALADDIRRQARIVELHESARKAFGGGHAEVSLFWIDAETGVRMKCRADYLKVRAIVDIKTFSNPMGMPLDQAIGRAVANYRYHIQGAVYCDGVERAKELYREHGFDVVHGDVSKEWLDAFADPRPHAFVFVFLESGVVPNVRVREFRQMETFAKMGATRNLYWDAGETGYHQALQMYQRCLAHYGPELPWIDPQPIRAFVDSDFPPYMME